MVRADIALHVFDSPPRSTLAHLVKQVCLLKSYNHKSCHVCVQLSCRHSSCSRWQSRMIRFRPRFSAARVLLCRRAALNGSKERIRFYIPYHSQPSWIWTLGVRGDSTPPPGTRTKS